MDIIEVSRMKETFRNAMKRLRAQITWEACGLGFFWAWCYCLWFVPNLYSGTDVVSPGQNYSWLIVLGSAAVIQFLVPACLKTRRLSKYPLLDIVIPLITCIGTVCIELTSSVLPFEWLYYLGAIASGASSAFLWHLWGDYFAGTRNDNAESIALGFGIIVLLSIVATTLLPSVLSNIYVAATPLASGAILIAMKRKTAKENYPALLPKASRKTSRSAIVKICLIAFVVCTICTYTWSSIPLESLPLGNDIMSLGVVVGALFMIAAALPKVLFGESMPTAKILSWMIFLAAVAIALYLTRNEELASAAYIASLASSVVLDVLLATYFVALIVKGYVASSTAFGYSEGFICAGMLCGNILRNSLDASGLVSTEGTRDISLLLLCVLIALLILLNEQRQSIHEIMTAAPIASDVERNCNAIAEEFALSTREFEILVLIGQGHTPQSIAKLMVISPLTVQTHIKHIYQKMGIHSRSELLDYINLQKTAFTDR